MSFRMVGEAMNKAHRLVETAEDGQVVVSGQVYQALVENAPSLLQHVPFREIGPIALKGFSTPQILFVTQIERPALRK